MNTKLKNKISLVILIACLSSFKSFAQYYLPPDGKERAKLYVQYLNQCKDAIAQGGNKNYTVGKSNCGYLKALEPDSTEPFKLEAICACSLNDFKGCCKNAGTYLKRKPADRDTLLLKFRTVSFIQLLNQTKDSTYYDSAYSSCNELIDKFSMKKFYLWRANLNGAYAMLWAGTNNPSFELRKKEYDIKKDADIAAYKSIYGEDGYYRLHIFTNVQWR